LWSKISESHLSGAVLGHISFIGRIGQNFSERTRMKENLQCPVAEIRGLLISRTGR
jgi:hypothetical protein